MSTPSNAQHTHPFNGPFSGTTQVGRYQKGKTNLDFTEARDSKWQWHQLGHIQVCTSLRTDNHASTPLLSFYRPDALPAAQPTASKHRRHKCKCTTLIVNCFVFSIIITATVLKCLLFVCVQLPPLPPPKFSPHDQKHLKEPPPPYHGLVTLSFDTSCL